MADVGYCDVEDVRETLQERELSGSVNETLVEAHILGESEWIQEDTNRHWYDPDAGADSVVGTDTLTHSDDELDVPSSPHAGPGQLFESSETGDVDARYPVRFGGPYTRVSLQRRDVTELTSLLVRASDGSYEDWTDTPEYEEGRGKDYYLQVDDSTGHTYLYLHAGALPPLANYDAAVVASYEYGQASIPKTVRQATASLAGAALLREDEQTTAVPDDGQLVSLDTRADELHDRGMRLLKIHR